jgi:hypothetical protein
LLEHAWNLEERRYERISVLMAIIHERDGGERGRCTTRGAENHHRQNKMRAKQLGFGIMLGWAKHLLLLNTLHYME